MDWALKETDTEQRYTPALTLVVGRCAEGTRVCAPPPHTHTLGMPRKEAVATERHLQKG